MDIVPAFEIIPPPTPYELPMFNIKYDTYKKNPISTYKSDQFLSKSGGSVGLFMAGLVSDGNATLVSTLKTNTNGVLGF